VLVVHSAGGMDEIGIDGPTRIAEMREGEVALYEVRPEDFGIDSASIEALQVSGPEESLARVLEVLDGGRGPASDVVALNAGAAIYVAGLADTLAAGVARAREVIASGEARERLDALVQFTSSL
jgi:anthranilate phosphoribosyltransferase